MSDLFGLTECAKSLAQTADITFDQACRIIELDNQSDIADALSEIATAISEGNHDG